MAVSLVLASNFPDATPAIWIWCFIVTTITTVVACLVFQSFHRRVKIPWACLSVALATSVGRASVRPFLDSGLELFAVLLTWSVFTAGTCVCLLYAGSSLPLDAASGEGEIGPSTDT